MTTTTKKKYLRFQVPARRLAKWPLLLHLLRGMLAFPFHWFAGFMLGAPGMQCRWRSFLLGLHLLAKGDFANAYRCIVWPLDSVRYFEFEYFYKALRARVPDTMLDISSPRLFLALALAIRPDMVIDGINPDANDLGRTLALMNVLGYAPRCTLSGCGVAELAPIDRKFALVTCMSVLEHIVNDLEAVAVMWSKVAPGGTLLLSMPCSAEPCEEYTNVDEYGLLERDVEGFVFWQRYYDPERLDALFAIAGKPVSISVFGEINPGFYDSDVRAKRSDPRFPRWREPHTLARTFKPYPDVSSLPGMGVVALEFRKPGAGGPCVEDGQ